MRKRSTALSFFGPVSERRFRDMLTPEMYARLFVMAHVVACLDGNAFNGMIAQYMSDAYAAIWDNSAFELHDGTVFPNLYPVTATDLKEVLDRCGTNRLYDDNPELKALQALFTSAQ